MSNIDISMLELFKIELDNHTKSLEEGLLDLEKNQTSEKINILMRASHSIKGAAKIVGLDIATKLAHKMEDVFTAALKKNFQLSSDCIDTLLDCNDLFSDIKDTALEEIEKFLINKEPDIDNLIKTLEMFLSGETINKPVKKDIEQDSLPEEHIEVPEPVQEKKAQAENFSPVPPAQKEKSIVQNNVNEKLSSVRLSAHHLNKLMGLSGEGLVQVKSMKPFSLDLLELKNLNRSIISIIEYLNFSIPSEHKGMLLKINDALKLSNNSQSILTSLIDNFEEMNVKLENISTKMYEEVIASRMRPFEEGLHGFSRMVRDLAKQLGKKINFKLKGIQLPVDRDILEKLEAPLTHLVRNAVDHGLENIEERIKKGKSEEGTLLLEVSHSSGMLDIFIRDDGNGIDIEKIRKKVIDNKFVSKEMADNLSKNELLDFLFLPGFTTTNKVTEISGRGVGLDVVLTMLQEIRGTVKINTELNKGTVFHLQLPISLSVMRTLIVEINKELYAIPLYRIDRIVVVSETEIETIEDKQFYKYEGVSIGIIDAKQLLNISAKERYGQKINIVIISDRMDTYGLVVDKIKNERDLVVIPLNPLLGKVPNISSGAILEDGQPILIFDVDDVVRSIDNILKTGRLNKIDLKKYILEKNRKRILIVDDSLTVREVERKLLESKGYDVSVAVDGQDGWNNIQNNNYDLVISDVDMPRMNGIELVDKIKTDNKYKSLPVIIVSYKDREEDRLKGLEAGANYYLTKSSFHDETFITAVKDLVGEA